jgi:hypothetical protein
MSHAPGNVNGDRRAGIGDCFSLEFPFLDLKVVRQHGGVAGKASYAAIGVVKHDEVKLPVASWIFSGNLADSSEHTQLLKQARGDSTADVTQHHGLARFGSKDVSRIDAHIRAADDDRSYVGHRSRKRGHQCAARRLLRGKFFVAL